jgi:hypothetical protein
MPPSRAILEASPSAAASNPCAIGDVLLLDDLDPPPHRAVRRSAQVRRVIAGVVTVYPGGR